MRREVPRDQLAWWAVAAALALVVAGVVVAFVGTFVSALFLYYVSRPVYRRLRARLGRTLAAAGALVALAVPVVILVAYTLLIGLQELQALAREVDLGPVQDVVDPYLDVSGIVQDPASILQDPDVVVAATLVVEGVYEYLPMVVVAVLHLFVALAATFYLLRDGPRLARWVRTMFDDEDTAVLTRYGRLVDEDLSSVFFGNILNAAITAGIGAILYNLLNVIAPTGIAVPYPALLGLLAGAASLVPVVGMKLVYVPVAALMFGRAFVEGDALWFPAAFFGVSLILVDTIPDLVLRPYVSGRNLHVGLVMIAYIIGPLLFGWYGLFLGPLLLVLVVHFGREVLPELLAGAPRPAGAAGSRAGTDPEYESGVVLASIDPTGALGGEPVHVGSDQSPPERGESLEDEGRADGSESTSEAPDSTTESTPETADSTTESTESSKPRDDDPMDDSRQ